MADLLFDLMPVEHKVKRFQIHDIALENFTDEELRSRFRFGSDSIKVLVEHLHNDLKRQTSRGHALSTTGSSPCSVAFLRLRKLSPSDR